MTTNKGVNRTFLITFLIYVGGSFLWSLIGKRFVDSFYVDIAVSQLLSMCPAVCLSENIGDEDRGIDPL